MHERALLLCASVLAIGCSAPAPHYAGIDPETGLRLRLTPEPLSTTAPLSGRYVSAQLGLLELTREGTRVRGRYSAIRGDCAVTGRLDGELSGSLWRFGFREQLDGCAHAGQYRGEGHALFDLPAPGDRSLEDPRVRVFGERHYQELVPGSRPPESRLVRRPTSAFQAVQSAQPRVSSPAPEPAR